MTRHYSAATAARASRALVGFGAAFVLAVVASGCVGSAAPVPTPDPFAGLADRSDQAFRQGLEAYGQGQYRDALTSFESARTLSPTDDARIAQMIERSRAALAPTPTPIPPKPTEVPAVPTATPILMSTLTPDTELGRRFFGQVTLSMVPGRDSDAPAATQFFYQDQIGLHIEGLKQHLRLPFTMRVFNTDASRLVAEIQSEDGATAVPKQASLQADPRVGLVIPTGLQAGVPTAVATATARDIQLARFWDTYVWYHKGGEEPGRYRLELFANGILTNSFDYTVGTVPIAPPEPSLAPLLEPTPALPNVQTADPPPPPAPAAQTTRPSQTGSGPSAAPVAPPEPTPLPTPTLVPTPTNAYTTLIGGLPGGLDVNSSDVNGRFYIADASGVIWTSDRPTGQQRPTLGQPWYITNPATGRAQTLVDIAVDDSTGLINQSGNVYVSVRDQSAVLILDGVTGRRLGTVSMQGAPGDLRIDADLGLLCVVVPELQQLVVINVRTGLIVARIQQLPQITSIAIDPVSHTLYAAHFGGQLTIIDVPTHQVTGRVSLTGAGLASVATARGLAYAVNSVTHELAVVEPRSQNVTRFNLAQEPAAVAAAEDSGAVYVLSSRSSVILRIDPTDGSEVGRVLLPARSGHSGFQPTDFLSLRPRLVVNRSDETVYATLPEAGTLAVAAPSWFPELAREIPRPNVDDQTLVATIPGLLRPGAPQLASSPAPNQRAQAPNPALSSLSRDEEGN